MTNATSPTETNFRRAVVLGAHVGLHPATIEMLEIEPCIYEVIDFRRGEVRVAPVTDPREVPGGVDHARARWVFSDDVATVYTDRGTVIRRSNQQ